MPNHIKKMHLKDLFDLFEQESRRLDVILCREDDLIDEVQGLLEDEKSVTLVTLEQDDLYDQKSILNGLHEIFFDEVATDNDDPSDIIQAIENELGELEVCLLIVEDFASCNIETQAALLELVIVSRTFKLLLKVDDDSIFSENENLWDVLAIRSGFLEKENHFFGEDEDFEQSEENIFQEDEIEQEQEASEFTPQPRNYKKQDKKPAWYQMLPKYHIAAGVFLVLMVFALWNMDITQKKEQNIDLPVANNIQESNPDAATGKFPISEAENIEGAADQISENNEMETTAVLNNETEKNTYSDDYGTSVEVSSTTELKDAAEHIQKSEVIGSVKEVERAAKENQQVVKKPAPTAKVAEVKVASIKVSTPTPVVPVPKKTNWSPYQSDKWIKGVNSKYYTLQLMASHDEQGVRNFLKEHGVSSQYSVYTTEKNNKPWHVIIYGVYQTHEFADKARKDLPPYLKSYSPWVRSFADVQKTIK